MTPEHRSVGKAVPSIVPSIVSSIVVPLEVIESVAWIVVVVSRSK